jgi:mercuric ion transport protein
MTESSCHDRPTRKRRAAASLNLALVPAFAAAAVPKCPLCVMGIMSSFGLGTIVKASMLPPLTLAFLAVTVSALGFGARRRRGHAPLFLGMVAAAAVMLGKYQFNYNPVVYVGVALLLGASLWNGWPKKRSDSDSDCEC